MIANLQLKIEEVEYPAADGKPMAETDPHRDLMVDLIYALRRRYQDDPNAYVSGNLFIYYVEGDPKRRVAPDVFIVFGVPNQERRSYRLWQEGHPPAVVFEISSRKTWREDLHTKLRTYAELEVEEYFVFDPEYDYLPEALRGYRLGANGYVRLMVRGGRVHSQVLGLDIVDTGETLRLYDPTTQRFLPTPIEDGLGRDEAESRLYEVEALLLEAEEQVQEAEAKALEAETKAQEAEAKAEAESQARQRLEKELARLQEELARLRRI